MSERPRHGSIDVPAVGSIPALVELDATTATALLLVRPLHALDGVVGTHVGIDVTTARGLMHVDARVTGVRDGELLDLEVDGDRELIQRREYARVDAVVEVCVAPAGARGSRPAVAVNISGSGAVLARLDDPAPGEQVDMWLALAPAAPPMRISGRVVRETEGELRAVRFEHVTQADRERIVHFVFERQRLELARTRRA